VRRLALGTIPESELPRVLMFDGGETRPDPAQDVGGEGGPPFFVMSPAVLVVVSGEDDGTLGPTLSGWMAAVKFAMGLDSVSGLPGPEFRPAPAVGYLPGHRARDSGRRCRRRRAAGRAAGQLPVRAPESELNPYLATGV
jgi:hypothetical protein